MNPRLRFELKPSGSLSKLWNRYVCIINTYRAKQPRCGVWKKKIIMTSSQFKLLNLPLMINQRVIFRILVANWIKVIFGVRDILRLSMHVNVYNTWLVKPNRMAWIHWAKGKWWRKARDPICCTRKDKR